MLNIIAEIGASHGHDLERAQMLAVSAMEGGADWVKLQTYTPDTISHKGAGVCPDGPWKGRPLYDLYQEAHMPREMQEAFIAWMKKAEIPWFSTPFSPEDVAWLEERDCPMYKISSFDRVNSPLIKAAMRTKKRIIASDGMGNAVGDIILRCVSQYPAHPKDYGLAKPPNSKAWGVSDHTKSSLLGVVAVAAGATWIEKHIKINEDTTTPDSAFAIECGEFLRQTTAWRMADEIIHSKQRPKSGLAGVMPKEIEIDGKKVWRRGAAS